MTFFKIQDPNKRDEIVRGMNERKKRIYQDSIYSLSNAGFQTGNNMINTILKESEDGRFKEGGSYQEAIASSSLPSTTPEMLTYQESVNVGAVASHYLKMYTSNKNQMDKTFGVHFKDGLLFIGKDQIIINNDDIIIGDRLYHGTKGLWELITKNEPDATIYNDEDYKNYREILIDTNAIRSDSNPNKPKASRSAKHRELIKPIWNEFVFKRRGKKGNRVIILPSDPKALVQRFALSSAAWHAGNKGSRNEAVSICDELLRQHVIDKKEYKSMIGYIYAK